MSEYSKEKLYYLKLPKEFFNEYYVKILEGMQNGDKYLILYMKLMCESISHGGYLRFSKEVPYTPEMIASITSTNIDVVRTGIKVLEDLGLMVETAEGSLFFPIVEKLTCSTTIGAVNKAIQRQGGQEADICPPYIRDLESKSLEPKSLKMKQDSTRYKQAELLAILLDFGFLDESELQDQQWDDYLDWCVSEHGYVDTKIKVRYVLMSISSYVRTGEFDKMGKPYFHWRVDEMPANKYRWFMVSVYNNQKAAIPKRDDKEVTMDDYAEAAKKALQD